VEDMFSHCLCNGPRRRSCFNCTISLSFLSYIPGSNIYLQQVIVATRRAHITGVSPSYARTLFAQNGPPNPIYRKNAYCVAATVILWPGVIASFARCVPCAPLSFSLHGTQILTRRKTQHVYNVAIAQARRPVRPFCRGTPDRRRGEVRC
jgi:hypothetical protein